MSPKSLATSYTIQGCRDGLPVTKIVLISGTNCQSVIFSDGGTETTPSQWTEGPCTGPVAIGGTDITIDLVGTGNNLTDYIPVTLVRSVTIVPYSNKMVEINGLPKLLKAGQAYTWSQGDEQYIDLSVFVFTVDGGQLEVIWEEV